MHPQVETTLSDVNENLSVWDILVSSEAIAVLAILVSVGTWFRSRKIEERIRADSDERNKFDIVFGNPFTARMELLESIMPVFGSSITCARSISALRASVSSLQKNEHSNWYFSLDSFLNVHDEGPHRLLNSELNEYWDQSSHLIDQIGNTICMKRAKIQARQLQALGERYLVRSRKHLVAYRTNLRGTPEPIFDSWLAKLFG